MVNIRNIKGACQKSLNRVDTILINKTVTRNKVLKNLQLQSSILMGKLHQVS
jgi:hypothetical protein